MKQIGANTFLFSILVALLLLPISFLKTAKLDQSSVLGDKITRIEYLNQKINSQEQRIKELEKELNKCETKETSESESFTTDSKEE